MRRIRTESGALRYRGVDRRTPAPAPETGNVTRWSLALVTIWALSLASVALLKPPMRTLLSHSGAPAACFAIVAGVAMFTRWRIEGRAQSWWLAIGYVVTGAPAFLSSHPGTTDPQLVVPAFAVAFVFFIGACRTPEVDSILSVRRAAATLTVALACMAGGQVALGAAPACTRALAAVMAPAFLVSAVIWARSQQHKPWFVLPLVGFAMCCATFALVAGATSAAAAAGPVLLLINSVAAATALNGLQASATGHRALALDAQRERDLVSSLRDDLEARYAETLHEVRSTLLALEGGIQVSRPVKEPSDPTLTHSLVAEVQRLRAIADPHQASVPADFSLAEALEHLVAVSRASGWPVHWNVDDSIVVRGRRDDVAPIVQELLVNARKYAPKAAVEISAIMVAHFVLVFVDDSGPGVRPENRERIFERGERPEHGDGEQGTGLGLHIARRLARSLGGELWVEEHQSGGARFVLALRRAGSPSRAESSLERTA